MWKVHAKAKRHGTDGTQTHLHVQASGFRKNHADLRHGWQKKRDSSFHEPLVHLEHSAVLLYHYKTLIYDV